MGRRTGYLATLDRNRAEQRMSQISGPEELRWADAVVLQELVLRDLLHIGSSRGFRDAHLSYIKSAEEFIQRGRAKDTQLVVMMNAPSMSTLWKIALEGGRLPEMTTYFVPELLCGLVLNGLADLS